MTDNEHLLVFLSEECLEVAHIVSKALRFGLQDIEPGQPFTNAQRIKQESTDIVAVMELVEEAGLLPDTRNIRDVEAKKAKVKQWLEYSHVMRKPI